MSTETGNRRSYKYCVVDVFTTSVLEGNPLAVFAECEGLDERTMQKIARELNLSESVFILDPTRDGCLKRFRIFTPAKEMPFAGHPTVGASYVLLKHGLVDDSVDRFAVDEKVGPVEVTLERTDPPMIWLETPPIRFERTFDPGICAAALRLSPADLLDVEPQLVDAGNPTLLVPVKSPEVVDRAAIDTQHFDKLEPKRPGSMCLFIFAPTPSGAYSRMFAPEYGIVEDPATGSSTGPLGAFMKRYGLLPENGQSRFCSEQGTKMGRRSLLYFEFRERPDGERVMVGGHVTPVIEGLLTLGGAAPRK